MKWASAVSQRDDTAAALDDVCRSVEAQLLGTAPDLLVVFVSSHHARAYLEVARRLGDAFPRARLLGCSADGVIGGGHEVEMLPALSLTAAALPGVTVTPFHVSDDALPPPAADGSPDADAYAALVGVPRGDDPALIVLADPFSIQIEELVRGLDAAYPRARKIGGLASAAAEPRHNALYGAGRALREGAVGVALTGNVVIDTIVAQGCRPIGTPLVVTRAERNLIYELSGRDPLDLLRALYQDLPARDQKLFRHSLFIGLEMNESALEHQSGDFLVRNILGVDPQTGSLAVGATVRPWQVVQLLLRDADTAEQDLVAHLERYRALGRLPPKGALLFSCLGRGQHLFGRADHDSGLFRDKIGGVPIGGFFCNGEIGQVGDTTFLHGYTSAFGLFREKSS